MNYFLIHLLNLKRITTYVKAPLTDEYIFTIYTDAGLQFLVNEEVIIDHFSSNPYVGYQDLPFGESLISKKINFNVG